MAAPPLPSRDGRKTSPQPLARLSLPDPETLEPSIRALYEANHRENWIAALSVNAKTAERFSRYFGSLFAPDDGLLPLAERELIVVAVSTTNGCGLCEIHHTNALAEALGDSEKARRIALDAHLAPLTAREHALFDLTVKVTTNPKSLGDSDFETLRGLGLSDPDILEAVEVASWFNHTNRIFISLGVVPDAKYFQR